MQPQNKGHSFKLKISFVKGPYFMISFYFKLWSTSSQAYMDSLRDVWKQPM